MMDSCSGLRGGTESLGFSGWGRCKASKQFNGYSDRLQNWNCLAFSSVERRKLQRSGSPHTRVLLIQELR